MRMSTRSDHVNSLLQRVDTLTADVCPAGCEPCSESCVPEFRYRSEYSSYDVFGRRTGRAVCDKPCTADNTTAECRESHPVYRFCQTEVTNYDYDGLSFQVLAERHGPFALEEFPHPDVRDPARYVGDRFVSTYLHGPLGPIARTAEGDNDDVSDNRDHYYLRDAMGGHMGVILDEDGDVSTAGHAAFATYDAFGNAMSGVHAAAGAFAWRGGEGSVTEREPDLVYMQARHYSPKIGRFVQADTVLVASATTQSMNRYAYTENDPVSRSDPTGSFGINSGPAIFQAIYGFLAVPYALGFAVGLGASFGLGWGALLAPHGQPSLTIFSTVNCGFPVVF